VADRFAVLPAQGALANDFSEAAARGDEFAAGLIEVAIRLVANQQAIVLIVDREAFGDALDCFLEQLAGLAGGQFGFLEGADVGIGDNDTHVAFFNRDRIDLQPDAALRRLHLHFGIADGSSLTQSPERGIFLGWHDAAVRARHLPVAALEAALQVLFAADAEHGFGCRIAINQLAGAVADGNADGQRIVNCLQAFLFGLQAL